MERNQTGQICAAVIFLLCWTWSSAALVRNPTTPTTGNTLDEIKTLLQQQVAQNDQLISHWSRLAEQMTNLIDSLSDPHDETVIRILMDLLENHRSEVDVKLDVMLGLLSNLTRLADKSQGSVTATTTMTQRPTTTTTTTTTTTSAPNRCGDILVPVPSSMGTPPAGWTICALPVTSQSYISYTPCRDLLQGLPGYANSEALVAAGGNFGCWKTSSGMASLGTSRTISYMCRPNYQHPTTLASCGHCDFLGVCINYPS